MCQFRTSWQNSLLLYACYLTIQRSTHVSIVSENRSSLAADSLVQTFLEMIKQNECGEIYMYMLNNSGVLWSPKNDSVTHSLNDQIEEEMITNIDLYRKTWFAFQICGWRTRTKLISSRDLIVLIGWRCNCHTPEQRRSYQKRVSESVRWALLVSYEEVV